MPEFCTPLYGAFGVSCMLCGATSTDEVEDQCLFEEVDDAEEGD